jgi:hypothetical protein
MVYKQTGDFFMDAIFGFFTGIVIAVAGAAGVWYVRKKSKATPKRTEIYSTIEDIRAVGELAVLRVLNKEIVTATDHMFGKLGAKYLKWLLTENKLAMIFEFNINFKYDLNNPEFEIIDEGDQRYTFKMPACLYDTNILNLKFYDEKAGELMPWLLPGMVTRILGATFTEEEKNFLIDEAKQQAMNTGKTLADQMIPEIQNGAKRTLSMLAKALGARDVQFNFDRSGLVQTKLDFLAAPQPPQQEPALTA